MGLWERDVDTVIEKLEAWSPARAGSEREYEEALYKHLNDAFPQEPFKRQYKFAQTSADLFIHFKPGAKVAVEVKADLVDRNEYHRLLGQVMTYLFEWECEVLVIVCGSSDPVLVKLARTTIGFLNSKHDLKVRFVEKACAVAAESKAAHG